MEIVKEANGTELTLKITGRIDAGTSTQLSQEVMDSISGLTRLVFDMSGVDYISSAGLRVLIAAESSMKEQGPMIIMGVNDNLMEIFSITGFTKLMDIQPQG